MRQTFISTWSVDGNVTDRGRAPRWITLTGAAADVDPTVGEGAVFRAPAQNGSSTDRVHASSEHTDRGGYSNNERRESAQRTQRAHSDLNSTTMATCLRSLRAPTNFRSQRELSESAVIVEWGPQRSHPWSNAIYV
ncbi:hypothetical protein Bbelb_059510 [Branchiostoma belcheri]|nr:hypothetical protein Bbelb_059510 [Branchiostoma belcheri]